MDYLQKLQEKYSKIIKDKSTRLLRYIGYAYSVIFVVIVAFYVYGQLMTESTDYFKGECYLFAGEWTWETGDSDTGVSVFPAQINTKDGSTIKATSVLPNNIDDGMMVCILTDITMKVYVDGVCRLDFNENENPIRGGFVKSHYITVPLRREDAGKTIVIDRYMPNVGNGNFNAVYYGNAIGLFKQYEKENGPQFIAACILLLLSIMVIIIGYIMLSVYKRKMPIIMLAYGTALASLWFIADSFLYQLYFGNYYVDGPLEYMLVMFFPYYFGRYLNYEQNRRYENLYSLLFIAEGLVFAAVSIMHFAGLSAYDLSLPYIGMVMLLLALTFAGTIIADIIRGHVRDYINVTMGYAGVLVFGIVQIVILVTIPDNHDAIPLVLGMYFLLIEGVINMIKNLNAEEKAANYAIQANELKSSFLANMSHEIRTPINAIIGFNEMISRESEEVHTLRYSNDIRTASDNLLGIVNDILDFSKIESGKMEIVQANYSISKLLADLRTIMNVRARKKRLVLNVLANENMPDELMGDSVKVMQVMNNLVTNAIKYTDRGEVEISLDYIDLPLTIDDMRAINLLITVRDTGIGIRDAEISKLFSNFERLDVSRNRNIEGTGLGLAITNSIVKLMGGTIEVQSVYGEGSTFIVKIPQKVVSEKVVGKLVNSERKGYDRASYKISFTAPGAKILVVDDVDINCAVVKNLLKTSMCEIVSVNSGEACLELCNAQDFDLILMDQMMPNMNGTDTLNKLKELWSEQPERKSCPVIVLTANAILGMREQYISEGFTDYLSKPTNAVDLEKMVSTYLPQEKVQYCNE